MSRIGKLPIKVPKNVNVTLDNKTFKAKGPHGELTQPIPQEINVAITDNLITLTKNEETIKARQKYGLTRSLLNNIVIGVSEKFDKKTANDWCRLSCSSSRKKINFTSRLQSSS
jgi:large subunit ribosomal protein L6